MNLYLFMYITHICWDRSNSAVNLALLTSRLSSISSEESPPKLCLNVCELI